MPIYEVHHSYPLTQEHKQALATAITDLHCHAFTTPRFFVHVLYHAHDASASTYFLAGRPNTTCTNRIVAQVRTSASRSRADFDALAERIERAWDDVLSGGDGDVGVVFGGDGDGGGHAGNAGEDGKGKDGGDGGGKEKKDEESEKETEAKRLLMISFYPMVAAREAGMVIPDAGNEGAWFKEQMPYMKKMADVKGLEGFKDMLHELDTREDLRKLVS